MEGAPNGTPVLKVHAVDEDKGVNGQVKYSIVQQPNQKGAKFTVNQETGEIFTNKVSVQYFVVKKLIIIFGLK